MALVALLVDLAFKNEYLIIRNNTQTAVTNMTIKRMLENKNSFNLTFRMFRHTSSEVTVKNRSNK